MGSPSPDAAPVPVSAVIHPATGYFVVTFSGPLQSGPSAAMNWYEAFGGTRWRPKNVSAGASQVSGTKDANTGPSMAQRITYTAAEPDVIGANGLPVAAFQIDATLG